ncbi:hypothetical protein [Micromonospora sp. DT233]|uniref:hypothetical protein n=1 Tax=Micromonospora sp. DT233 TaxID=3393432 RepID=UPI003CE69CCE
MERRVDLSNLDLDQAAGIIAERHRQWAQRGLDVGAPTWVDNDAGWPPRLLTDRGRARRPMSVGVRVGRENPYAEAVFVLYAGGWVDVDHVAAGSDTVLSERVELDDVEQFRAVLDRVVAQLSTG